jgi:hypothetical protein
VNETGYSESRPELDRDITRWLVGTAYGVLLAIETKFNKRQNSRVAGYVILHTNNGTTINRKARILLVILIPLYLNDHHLTVLGNLPSATESRRRSDCVHEARPLWEHATSWTWTNPWRYLYSRCFDHSPSCCYSSTKDEFDTCLIGTSSAQLLVRNVVGRSQKEFAVSGKGSVGCVSRCEPTNVAGLELSSPGRTAKMLPI